MAIAYGSAGAGGGTESNGASLDLACPATVNANDFLIAHVTFEGLTNAPTEPADWDLLYGPANLGTGTAVARSWVYGKLAVGDEDGDTIGFGSHANTSGRYGRIYSFTGFVSGTLAENVPASSFTDTPTEGSIPLPTVTTTVTDALAVALLVQDDNNSFAAAGAVTGGTWAEPVAEFVSTTLGVQGCVVGIQTSTPTANPGTITGGTANATADEGSTIGFQITPTVPPPPPDPALDGAVVIAEAASNAATTGARDVADGRSVWVFVTHNNSSAATITSTVTDNSASITPALVHRQNTQQGTTAEVWRGYNSSGSTVSGYTVTATGNNGGTGTLTMTHIVLAVFSGEEETAAGDVDGASNASGLPSVTLTTTRDESWVWAVKADWSAGGTGTPSSGEELVDSFHNAVEYTSDVWRQIDHTATASTSVTTNETAPSAQNYNAVAVEIRPAAGGDATATPAVIARSFALPAAGAGVGAAPAVIARSFTTPQASAFESTTVTPAVIARSFTAPQAAVGVGAAPVVTARAFTLPQAGAGVGAAPAVIARSLVLPASSVSVGASPAVLAALVALPQTVAGVGAAPAVIPLVVTLPQATAGEVGGGGATATPAVIDRAFTVPQVAVGVGAAPAVIVTVVALPQAAVGIGSAPAVIARAFSLPQVAISVGAAPAVIARAFTLPQATPDTGGVAATATPDVIARAFALPQPNVSVGVLATVIARSFTLPQATAAVSITALPAVIARAFALAQATVGVGASPTTIAVTVTFPEPFLPGQLRVLISVDTFTTAGVFDGSSSSGVLEASTVGAGQPS